MTSPTSAPGSLQQRRYLDARAANLTRREACDLSDVPLGEAALIDAELAMPPVPHLFDALDAPVVRRA